MVNFKSISKEQFLAEYWQKKPLVIRNALSNFRNLCTPEELAGLAMEEEVESRIVVETPKKSPYWHLKRGPFSAREFKQLPQSHWTLLVQGVDRFLPKVNLMLDHFNFLPQWRVDDVMISYAVEGGSVGPHYDHYDVFLYQAMGRRKWSLTTKNCQFENSLPGVELRIMKDFQVEQEWFVEEGDMLYLPPHVGHHGVAFSSDCMTYSFGYRSYQNIELWEDFADYLRENELAAVLYQDPDWRNLQGSAELPREAWQNAKKLMQGLLADEERLRSWFGRFVTKLDPQAEELCPPPDKRQAITQAQFMKKLSKNKGFLRCLVCRFAYEKRQKYISLFINGEEWPVEEASLQLIKLVANSRFLAIEKIEGFLKREANRAFLFNLWQRGWLELIK
jgi:50S ribosomal protein L16 3-hydroxylase